MFLQPRGASATLEYTIWRGSIADAKSILGMMNLDFSHPVELVSENERDLNRVYKALKN